MGVRAPILAFRPSRVVERLGPRSAACPLSSRDLLRAAAVAHVPLPLVQAPTPAVVRAALVAAKQARSLVGLALPAGSDPEPWFWSVIDAADTLAALWPIFLSGEVVVEGAEPRSLEAATAEAWRLADAGLTHLAVDLTALPAEARADALQAVAEPAVARGMGLECLVEAGAARGVPALFSALADDDAQPDMASLQCEAPAGPAEAQAQVKSLLELCGRLSGTPILRRGPVTPALLASLRGAPVAGCDDGGAAAAAVLEAVAAEGLELAEAVGRRGPGALARAEAALSEPGRARLETRAYLKVLDFLEQLGASGSAPRVAEALGRLAAAGGP